MKHGGHELYDIIVHVHSIALTSAICSGFFSVNFFSVLLAIFGRFCRFYRLLSVLLSGFKTDIGSTDNGSSKNAPGYPG